MTRGKYADRAEKTRDLNTTKSELEAGRTAVARLTAENKQLRKRAEEAQRLHQARVRALEAQVREGTSAEVSALRSELTIARDEAAHARAERAQIKDTWDKLFVRMVNYLQANGMTGNEAVETLVRWTGGADKVFDPDSYLSKRKNIDDEGVARIQRARGQRR